MHIRFLPPAPVLASALFAIAPAVVEADTAITGFDSFSDFSLLSGFPVGDYQVNLSWPGRILATGASLNPLATAPSTPNVLFFDEAPPFVMEFSEPMRAARFTTGSIGGYNLTAQAVKPVNIEDFSNFIAGLIVKKVAQNVIPEKLVAAAIGTASIDVGTIANALRNKPDAFNALLNINDSQFGGIAPEDGKTILTLYRGKVQDRFPIDQGLNVSSKTSNVFGFDRLFFETKPGAGHQFVLDNFELQPLGKGVRSAQDFMLEASAVLNSTEVKSFLTGANAGAITLSVLAGLGTKGIGAAPAFATQAGTLKATSVAKLSGAALSVAEFADPPNIPYTELFIADVVDYISPGDFDGVDPVVVDAIRAYLDALGAAGAAGQSLEETVYRYATAGMQGDTAATLLQSQHADKMLEDYTFALKDSAARAADIAALLENNPNFDDTITAQNIADFKELLITDGLPAAEVELLRKSGFTEAEIDDIKTDLIDLSDSVEPGPLSKAFADIGTSLDRASMATAEVDHEAVEIKPLSLSVSNDIGSVIDDLMLRLYGWTDNDLISLDPIDPFGTLEFTMDGLDSLAYHSFSIFSDSAPIFGVAPFDDRITGLTLDTILGEGALSLFDDNPLDFIDGNTDLFSLWLPDVTGANTGVALDLLSFAGPGGTGDKIGGTPDTPVSPVPIPASGVLMVSAFALLLRLGRRR